jgi:uncharacterized protein involved in outer membrane biogenesis
MTRRRKTILALAGVFGLPIVAVVLYLAFSDLSGWRDTIARVASKGMARELTIAGEFEVDLGIVTRVHATELSLANTDWGSEPSMATLDRLDGEINLWELFSGSIHLPSVDIEGGRAIFESDAEAGSNWRLGSGDGTGGGGPVRLRIDGIRAENVDLVFRTASDSPDWDLTVASLDSSGDELGNHQLAGSGTLRDLDFDLSGEFGSFAELINLMPVEHDLELQLGRMHLTSSGSIADIASLSGLDLRTMAVIPTPDELTGVLGLPATGIPAFTAEATTAWTSGLSQFTLTANGPSVDLHAEGTFDSLISPTELDLDLQIEGPDIRPVGALAGIADLDEKPFDLEGHFAWSGFPIVVSGLEIRVGENWVAADGRLGKPPLMLETDFRLEGAGPDLAGVALLAGLRMPHDVFEIDCHLLRVEGGLEFEDVRAKIGPALLTATGFVGDPPHYKNTELTIEGKGPNLAHFSETAGLDLPEEPFHVKGRFTQGDGAIDIHEADAKIGRATIEADGRLTTVDGLIGTDLTFVADGLDALDIGDLLGFDRLPSSSLHAEGRISVTGGGYRLQDVSCRIEDMGISAHGLITRKKHFVGTTLEITADGNDLSILDQLVPAVTLPPETFQIKGTLELHQNDYRLVGIEFGIDGASGTFNGRIGKDPGLNHSEIEFDAHGPSLAVADSLVPLIDLPDAPFSAAGGVTVNDGIIGLENVTIGLADTTARIDGHLVPSNGLIGTAVHTSIEGPNIDQLVTLIDDSIARDLPTLPAKPFSVAGDLTIDEAGYHLSSLEFSHGDATSTINGVVGRPPEFIGSDIEFQADGSDASLIAAAVGVPTLEGSFSFTGRVGKEAGGFRFDDVRLRLGDHSAEVDGRLGKLPKLIGTSLEILAKGPDLDFLREVAGLENLASEPFEFTGQFDGDPHRFKSTALDFRFGSSDITGDLTVDVRDKPGFTARLVSNHVEVADFIPGPKPAPDATDQDHESTPAGDQAFKLSDEPWNLEALDLVNIDLDWTINGLDYLRSTDREAKLAFSLEDGELTVDRFRATGSLNGTIDGSAKLTKDPKGHRIEIEFHIEDGMINLAGEGADPDQYTPTDFHLSMAATGRSPHEMMASSNGRVLVTIEGGVMEKGLIDKVSADFLVTLLDALNPFAKQDNYTTINCAVFAANFEDGVMTLDPAAFQTSKVTILGDGTLDFSTEELRLDWITKPRKGIGISASMFTNPYIRLGGTLAKPQIEMKPAQAVASTGLAVATMGLSFVAKGMADRITAEKKVCEKAMKQVEEQLQPQPPK